MAGFWAKPYVFWAAAQAGLFWLVAVGAVLTVALFYYLILAKRIYIDAPAEQGRIPVPASLGLSLLVCALGVVALGAYPKSLVVLTLRAASGLF